MENGNRIEKVYAVYHEDVYLGSFENENDAKRCLELKISATERWMAHYEANNNVEKFIKQCAVVKPKIAS